MTTLRVAIVGTCASGKSSVVAALRERGIDAWAVAQEHSGVPELWRHLGPDRLVLLDATLATVRGRRADPAWPEWIFRVQQDRLANARANADVVIGTDGVPLDEIVRSIIDALG